MKKHLLFLSAVCLLSYGSSIAQTGFSHIVDGVPGDSVTISFEHSDSLHKTIKNVNIILDTGSDTLWQAGNTTKNYFSSGSGISRGLMTDTVNYYPTNANNSFTIDVDKDLMNMILSFRHKYQTDSTKDGCIVEYTIDTGKTWNNVAGECNVNHKNATSPHGIITDNFYGPDDTLLTGEAAFSGNSNGWRYSRLQMFFAIPIRTTGGFGNCYGFPVQFRFRFVSDNTSDTLDGWMIDDIKIEADLYGSINNLNQSVGEVYPNPVQNILTIKTTANEFSDLKLVNSIGQVVTRQKVTGTTTYLGMKELPAGIYYLLLTGKDGTATQKIEKH